MNCYDPDYLSSEFVSLVYRHFSLDGDTITSWGMNHKVANKTAQIAICLPPILSKKTEGLSHYEFPGMENILKSEQAKEEAPCQRTTITFNDEL